MAGSGILGADERRGMGSTQLTTNEEPEVEQEFLDTLYQTLATRYDLEELRTLCFRLSVDYDSLRGEGKMGRARELIQLLDRRGRIPELVEIIKRQYPDVTFDQQTTGKTPTLEGSPVTETSSSENKPWVQIAVALIGAAAIIIAALIGLDQFSDNNGQAFSYQVQVLDSATEQAIQGAHVTIIVGGEIAPIDDYANSKGFVILSIDASRAGKLGKVSIKASGYEDYSDSINLNQDALPKTIKLEPSP